MIAPLRAQQHAPARAAPRPGAAEGSRARAARRAARRALSRSASQSPVRAPDLRPRDQGPIAPRRPGGRAGARNCRSRIGAERSFYEPLAPASSPTSFPLLLPACAALQDTPRQAKAREEWKQCEGSVVGVRISRVEADGRTWFVYESPSALAAAHACIASVRAQNARPGQAASPAARVEPTRTALAEPPRRQADAESSVWAYTTVSETMASFSLVAYTLSKIDCEANRARDLYTFERDSPWLKATLEECRSALVLSGQGFGRST